MKVGNVLKELYLGLSSWFETYTRAFLTGDKDQDHGFELKILHTHNVEAHTDDLSRALGLPEEQLYAAKIAALLHDIGRFDQFKRYRTFNDSLSEDHGQIGIELIEGQQLLGGINCTNGCFGSAIRFAVFQHNKLSIDKTDNEMAFLLAKIIRDADRIDILRIMAEQFGKPMGPGQEAVFLHLDESKTVSDAVYASVCSGQMVQRQDLDGRSDFLCMILSWGKIMNFTHSCEVIMDSGTFDILLRYLPIDERGKRMRKIFKDRMDDRLAVSHGFCRRLD